MFSEIENIIQNLKISELKSYHVFDVFENEKLGENKKAIAISFEFLNSEIQQTDSEIDALMSKITTTFENQLKSFIRK